MLEAAQQPDVFAGDLAQRDGDLRFGDVFPQFLLQQVAGFRQRQPPDVHPRQQVIVDLAVRANGGDGARVGSTQNLDLQTVARAKGERRSRRPQQLWIQPIGRSQGGGVGGQVRKLGRRSGSLAGAAASDNARQQ